MHGTVSELEAGGVTWIIILLFCFSEHCLAMNHQEKIDEASPGAPWGAGVVAAEGSAVGSCAGHWVWDLHLQVEFEFSKICLQNLSPKFYGYSRGSGF